MIVKQVNQLSDHLHIILKMCQNKGGGKKDVCITHLREGLQWVVIFELAS